MSNLLSRVPTRIITFLFGQAPATYDDACAAIASARTAITQVLADMALREREQTLSTLPLKELCDGLRRYIDDAELYVRTKHFGMAAAVANRVELCFSDLHKLLEEYSGCATVNEIMVRRIEKQGPIYPPRLSKFQSWMREHVLPVEDPRRQKLALR